MFYAEINGATHVPAVPSISDAWCPVCRQPVRSKCGSIKAWHWAHVSAIECDDWAEPDSTWHRDWQSKVDIDRREVVIGNHRADIITCQGGVIELQHSSISPEEIAVREAFYGRQMAWLFDAREAYAQGRLLLRRKPQAGSANIFTFRWKQPRKSVSTCRRTVWLDLDDRWVLRLGRIYSRSPCGGWGTLFSADEFVIALNESP